MRLGTCKSIRAEKSKVVTAEDQPRFQKLDGGGNATNGVKLEEFIMVISRNNRLD